jgi:hypothetical protein
MYPQIYPRLKPVTTYHIHCQVPKPAARGLRVWVPDSKTTAEGAAEKVADATHCALWGQVTGVGYGAEWCTDCG